MRFPQISLEWMLLETGDMFQEDDGEISLSISIINEFSKPNLFSEGEEVE
ncbi:hypothetical protein [Flavilitoribacter nigricans]|nr:hypothetical protein [Flavilitoribacter nigricans]